MIEYANKLWAGDQNIVLCSSRRFSYVPMRVISSNWIPMTSLRFFWASSLVLPWETKSSSGHLAKNQEPLRHIWIDIWRFIVRPPFFWFRLLYEYPIQISYMFFLYHAWIQISPLKWIPIFSRRGAETQGGFSLRPCLSAGKQIQLFPAANAQKSKPAGIFPRRLNGSTVVIWQLLVF